VIFFVNYNEPQRHGGHRGKRRERINIFLKSDPRQDAYPTVEGRQDAYPTVESRQDAYPTVEGRQDAYPTVEGRQDAYPTVVFADV
jgi:hypothetical protein